MKPYPFLNYAYAAIFGILPISAQGLLGSAVPPEATEQWAPSPPIVGIGSMAPSDAIVLFAGDSLEAWEPVRENAEGWIVENDRFLIDPGAGDLRTRQEFGSIQLHLEFRTPEVVKGEGQGRGNSGVFLMGRYEIQILDSFENPTYVNGQLGSVYKQYPPLANPARAPGEWQTYDIIFIAPEFGAGGTLLQPARTTVLLNGVLVQFDAVLKGPTTYQGLPDYQEHPSKQPLVLQDHGDRVAFRNIWIRELDRGELLHRTILEELRQQE